MELAEPLHLRDGIIMIGNRSLDGPLTLTYLLFADFSSYWAQNITLHSTFLGASVGSDSE